MSMPTVDDLKGYKSAHNFYMPLKQLLLWCSLIVGLMLVMGAIVAHILAEARYAVVTENVQNRLEVRASAKTEVIRTWLKGLDGLSRSITESDVFRLYVAEAVLTAEDKKNSLSKALKAQEPYLQKSLQEYGRRNAIVNAALVGRTGRVLLNSGDDFMLNHKQKQLVNMAIAQAETQVAPLDVDNGTMVLMYVKPIFNLDVDGKSKSIATLVSFFDVSAAMTHNLSEGPLSLAGERTHFLQKRSGMMEYLDLTRDMPALFSIKPEQIENLYIAARNYPRYSSYVSPLDNEIVFGASNPIIDTPFVLLQEYGEDAALESFYAYRTSVYISMVLIVFIISSGLSALLIYVLSARNRIRVTHQQQMLNALVRAVEIRDPYLSGHHERVARIALKVGNAMRLTVPERSTLYYSAMLSSVGKIFIPQKILAKPGDLTNKERDVLQEHVDHAEKVLNDIQFDLPVSEVIHQMYERMDGSGYPYGRSGSQINLLSRVLGICDVYCALTRPRSYREALSVDDALDVIEKENMKYDKGVAAILKSIVHGETPS